MTPKDFQAFALKLPETTEEPHFERTSFRVNKKIFATMTPDGEEAMVKVTPPEKVQMLLDSKPDVFFSYGGWTARNGSLGVRLRKAASPLVRDLLSEAWRSVAPRRLVNAAAPAKSKRRS